MKKILIAILLLIPALSFGKTIDLTTCYSSDVQSALNSSTDGDIIVCHSGSWDWENTVTWLETHLAAK